MKLHNSISQHVKDLSYSNHDCYYYYSLIGVTAATSGMISIITSSETSMATITTNTSSVDINSTTSSVDMTTTTSSSGMAATISL